ncbi:hypothetical protein GOC60_14585 [Sinorhizobium meliloti]|nr:hypothetical protein [Sinorhizobium meliloti]
MTKHTPGPWETGQAAWNEDGDVMYTLHGIKVATVADCRLIGAAPDLLEALKGILSNPGGRCSAEQWQAGLRAIAKAEGRA